MNVFLNNDLKFKGQKISEILLYKKVKPFMTSSQQRAFYIGDDVKTIWIISFNLQALLYRSPWIVNDLSKSYHLILRPLHFRDLSFKFRKNQIVTFSKIIQDITLNNFDSVAILTDIYLENFIHSLNTSSNLKFPKILFFKPQTQAQKWLYQSLLHSTSQDLILVPESAGEFISVLESLNAGQSNLQEPLKLQ